MDKKNPVFGRERRKGPQPLDPSRPADTRMPGETAQAYLCFLAYLEEGNIRDAAAAIGKNRSTLERHSKRWRWPERVRSILRGHAQRQRPLAEFERQHDLPAAKNAHELLDRQMDAFAEIELPRQNAEQDAKLQEMLARPVEKLPQPEPPPRLQPPSAAARTTEPEPFDPEEDMRIVMDRILGGR